MGIITTLKEFFANTIGETSVQEDIAKLKAQKKELERARNETDRCAREVIARLNAELAFQKKVATVFQTRCQQLEIELEQYKVLATKDRLTGLLNRQGLFEGVTVEASAHGHKDPFKKCDSLPFAIIIIDLDNFKSINDTNGHDAGDKILRAFAELLRKVFSRKGDLICRWGGDEFVIVMPHTALSGAYDRANLLEHLIASSEELCSGEIRVGASIGIASMILEPTSGGLSAETVEIKLKDAIRDADTALYCIKRDGKGKVAVHQS